MSVLHQLNQYGVGFQVKVLSSLLKHKEFVQNINDIIDPSFFDSPAHQWIVTEVLRYYYKYHTTPTPEALAVEVKKIENEVLRVSVADQVKESLKASNEDQEYVEQEFSNFCKNQQLKKALLNSVELLSDPNRFDEIRTLIDHALKAGMDKNIGHEYEKDIEARYRLQTRNAIPTHWGHLNELLMGGLGSGDLGLIFGNPGGGKSWMLINLGATAAMLGFKVCHYTLELSEDYVGKRYDSIFSGIDFQDIQNHKSEIADVVSKIPGKITIKEFPPGKATINTIESHIQKCKDLGFAPDLVIIDYVDLLRSKTKSTDPKDAIDDVYTATKGLAKELKVPVWTVSQVNRSGAKDDVIEGDKAAGSYNKMMIADFAMSLSRKREDKVKGTGRIHIMKNRYGMDGMTYSAKISTSNGRIDISKDEMGDDELDFTTNNGQSNQGGFKSGFNQEERDYLTKKFYELSI